MEDSFVYVYDHFWREVVSPMYVYMCGGRGDCIPGINTPPFRAVTGLCAFVGCEGLR